MDTICNDKQASVERCHFDGVNPFVREQAGGGEFYLAPGSKLSGLYIAPRWQADSKPFGLMDDNDDDTFEPGDIVELASGGPDMVVLSTCPNGCIEVAWGEDDKVRIDVFPSEALIDV